MTAAVSDSIVKLLGKWVYWVTLPATGSGAFARLL